MRSFAGIVLVLSLLGAWTAVAAVNCFQYCPAPLTFGFRALVDGDFQHLFSSPYLWRGYTTLPQSAWLVQWRTVGLVGMFVLTALWLVRVRRHKNWLWVGLTCLPAVGLCYAIARIALHDNTVPERAGPWLTSMVLGTLYALLACAFFAGIHLLSSPSTPRRKPVPARA